MTEEYLKDCAMKAADACTKGNYRHNQNPHFAALWSNDSDIRIGAIILCEHLFDEGLLSKQRVIAELKRRQDVEIVGNVGNVLHIMIRYISLKDS